MFFKKWNPEGLHVYVTGGSSGLGLSLAVILTERGANVSIVAKNQKKLEDALAELENVRKSPEQKLKAYSSSLNTARDSSDALHAVCKPYEGQAPDTIFACVGASKPMFFMEMEESDLIDGMSAGYWVQAWTAFAATKLMARQEREGKIVFVSSTLGYMSFLGWSSYSPAKHALRGLADTLQSELKLYGIDVHIFFPPTIFTLGYDRENKTKPKIVREIEGTDDGLTANQAAFALFKGVESGHTHITGDLITSLFRSSTQGAAPHNNWILDGIYDFVAFIAAPIWCSSVDKKVVSHQREHNEYLRGKGFFT